MQPIDHTDSRAAALHPALTLTDWPLRRALNRASLQLALSQQRGTLVYLSIAEVPRLRAVLDPHADPRVDQIAHVIHATTPVTFVGYEDGYHCFILLDDRAIDARLDALSQQLTTTFGLTAAFGVVPVAASHSLAERRQRALAALYHAEQQIVQPMAVGWGSRARWTPRAATVVQRVRAVSGQFTAAFQLVLMLIIGIVTAVLFYHGLDRATSIPL
jgi:hypothetical protein